MSNSTHEVTIVPIEMTKHPHADTLSVVNVFGGYTCVVRTQDWQGVKLGAYIPPDSLVDTSRPEFSFLASKARADGLHRVKAMKLRQIVSFGLMIPAPEGSVMGQDVATQLGVTHYEPPMPGEQRAGNGLIFGGEVAKAPDLNSPKYDLDAFRKYHSLLIPGEKVWITEKIHGCSARYVYDGEKMHCGSKNEWKKEYASYDHITMEWLRARVFKKEASTEVDEERCQVIYDKLHNQTKSRNLWWNALSQNPEIEKWCRDNPNKILYGEVFGQVQNLKYGVQGLAIATFDIMVDGRWLDAQEARDAAPNVPWVPYIGTYDYEFETVVAFSDGPSVWPGAQHYREGCVVKPLIERTDLHLGRVCLKCVGSTYLEKDK